MRIIAGREFYFAYPICKNCFYQDTILIPVGTLEKEYVNSLEICPSCGCKTLPGREKKEVK